MNKTVEVEIELDAVTDYIDQADKDRLDTIQEVVWSRYRTFQEKVFTQGRSVVNSESYWGQTIVKYIWDSIGSDPYKLDKIISELSELKKGIPPI